MKKNRSQGLASEYKVMEELKRRGLPFKHREVLDFYEIDFLVGKRIIIEVDGYMHMLKGSIERDRRKEEYFEKRGYYVLRITGTEAHNRGILRDFGVMVKDLYAKEIAPKGPEVKTSFQQSLDKAPLRKLQEELAKEGKKGKASRTVPKKEELSDEELFRQWIQREEPRDKDRE